MLKDVFESIGTAARKMFTNWGALLISLLLYLALFAVLYFFFTTREATKLQVLLSLVILPVAAIAVFFVLQAMGLSYVRIGVGPIYLFKRAAKDSWRLLLVSLPLALLAWLIIYLFAKAGATYFSETLTIESPWRSRLGMAIDWLRVFLLYFVIPLLAIHLWISVVREGLRATFKGIGRSIKRAFAPQSVLTYLVVVSVFGVIAYFLFFTRTPAKSEWVELWVLGGRLAAALIVLFIGWLLTLGSLAELTAQRALRESEPQ
jgi:hypothetical protein